MNAVKWILVGYNKCQTNYLKYITLKNYVKFKQKENSTTKSF